MKIIIIIGLCAACLWGCVSTPITSANYSDKNANKSISELHSRVGNQYWFPTRSVVISFIEEPKRMAYEEIHYDKYKEESFSITDFLWIEKYRSYYKVVFGSGKVAWTGAFLFDLDGERQLLKEDPKIAIRKEIESEIQKKKARTAKEVEERNNRTIEMTEVLKKNGISVGSPVWMQHPKYGFTGLQKVLIRKIGITPDIYSEVELVGEAAGVERPMKIGAFSIVRDHPSYHLDTFYVSDPAKKTAKWGKSVLKAIHESKVMRGMTNEQAMTSWGPPNQINRSGGQWGLHEQWVYGDHGQYLYFENGRLSSWQN